MRARGRSTAAGAWQAILDLRAQTADLLAGTHDLHHMTDAVATAPRWNTPSHSTSAMANGRIAFCHTTVQRSVSGLTRLMANIGNPAGVTGASPFAKIGVYRYNATADTYTLLVETDNTPALFAPGGTFVEVSAPLGSGRGLPTTLSVTRGETLAFAAMYNNYTTIPSVVVINSAMSVATFQRAPRSCRTLSGQTDLPLSIAAGGTTSTSNPVYLAAVKS